MDLYFPDSMKRFFDKKRIKEQVLARFRCDQPSSVKHGGSHPGTPSYQFIKEKVDCRLVEIKSRITSPEV